MNTFIQGLSAEESPLAQAPLEIIRAFGNSFVLGLILMMITVWASYQIAKSKNAPSEKDKNKTAQDMIFTSMNVLFLCFGMTAVMLLVNNNLARAFAIGAAIALIRFRVKVDNKAMSMALLYGVLTGMACGVSQFIIAWTVTGAFGILMVVSLSIAAVVGKQAKKTIRTKAEMQSPAPIALTGATQTRNHPAVTMQGQIQSQMPSISE